MWYYPTSIGLLRIVRLSDGLYYFMFGNDKTVWTGHADPQVVADDVRSHFTGCSEWDNANIAGPHDLSEWKRR